jgi:hypothetical protein
MAALDENLKKIFLKAKKKKVELSHLEEMNFCF